MKYQVYVDDNFHYQDESERYLAGEYDTVEDAIAEAKGIVDEFLQQEYRPGMTAEELYDHVSFGDDPSIRSEDKKGSEFSAWDYAKQQSEELCR
jgi:hypothetical protein